MVSNNVAALNYCGATDIWGLVEYSKLSNSAGAHEARIFYHLESIGMLNCYKQRGTYLHIELFSCQTGTH